jgi:hypothetical protein
MTLIQSTPTEIRELNLDTFRLNLRDLEDDPDGRPWPKTHTHNTEQTVAGIQLARVINILDPYTVTFEDGQYAVNLVGANSNVADKTNVNQVSVRPQNSAGLVNSRAIEFGEFANGVFVDQSNVTGLAAAGTLYPTGSQRQPSDNFNDANLISDVRGQGTLRIIGGASISTPVAGKSIEGQNAILSTITVFPAADVTNCSFTNLSMVDSTLDGNNLIERCSVRNLTYVEGILYNCALSGNIQIASLTPTYFLDCKSGCVGLGDADLPVLDLANGQIHLALRNWAGPVKIINSSDEDTTVCIDVVSGATVILDSTVSAGKYFIRGQVEIQDNTTGTAEIHSNAALEPQEVRDTWRRLGLDPDVSVTNFNDGSYQFGSVSVGATQGASGEITQQRV